MNRLIDAYTIGFMAPQGHGKTYTMIKMINQHPETDAVVFSTEVNEDEMIRRFGLVPRANLRVIYNPKPSIDDIIALSYQLHDTYIFIDYLQDTIKNGKFWSMDETISADILIAFNEIGRANHNRFYINLQALKDGTQYRGSGKVIDKLHILITQDKENQLTLVKNRYEEGNSIMEKIQQIVRR